MKTIIAGSRVIIKSGFEITEVICGEAGGVDEIGRKFAEEYNIPIISMPADWQRHGKSAGYKRNEEMAKIADACIVVWTGENSPGSSHMIDMAKKYNLKLYVDNIYKQ